MRIKGKNVTTSIIVTLSVLFIPSVIVSAEENVKVSSEPQLEVPVNNGDETVEEVHHDSSEIEIVDEQNTTEDKEVTSGDNKADNNNESLNNSAFEDEIGDSKNQQMTLTSFESHSSSVLEYGVNDDRVIELKIDLNKLGFKVSDNPTGYFGRVTEDIVTEFQQYYDLSVNGKADQITLEKIEQLLSTPLQNGISDERTIKLKDDLAKLGFIVPGNGTAYFGPQTEAVVKDFQATYDLKISGIAEEKTLGKIEELLTGAMTIGLNRSDVKQLKLDLEKLGFKVSDNPTNYYGPVTERVVSEFQTYYNIVDEAGNGSVSETTLNKISDLLDTPLQLGKSYSATVQLKKDLEFLDFKVPGNGTSYYGLQTEEKVAQFQSAYGLRVSGIAEEKTLAKIEELISGPMYNGLVRLDVIDLKKDLEKLGFFVSDNPTSYYGPQTESVVKKFQKYYGITTETGTVGDVTKTKIKELLNSELQLGAYNQATVNLKIDLGRIGYHVPGSGTPYYGNSTKSTVERFQSDYGLVVSGIVDEFTANKIEELYNGPMFLGLSREDVIQLKINLDKLGFHVSTNPTEYYGTSTEAMVKNFQKYYGITVEKGKVGEVTQSKIEELLNLDLQLGNTNEETIKLKNDLAKLGFIVPGNGTEYFGTETEKKVKEFQEYYDLVVNGLGDAPTLSKINNILKESLQNGTRDSAVIKLKENLATLGYVVAGNMTDYFGPLTAEQVRAFQETFNLPVSGIADYKTIEKLEYIIKTRVIYTYTNYNLTFNEALNIQMTRTPQTDKYRNDAAYVHKSDLVITEGASVIEDGVRLRTSPYLSSTNNVYVTVNSGTPVTILDKNIRGDAYQGSYVWYKIAYNGNILYVHSLLVQDTEVGFIKENNTKVYASKSTSGHVFGYESKNERMNILAKEGDWYRISYDVWRLPTRNDVSYYMNPNNNDNFQHLLLTQTVGVSATEINKLLKGKGILEGKGQAFIDAARKHSINEVYLISHALLETNHGRSSLATGIKVNGKTVYNMFGIQAYDKCPVTCGSEFAYEQNWDTPEKAIIGGAKFIGEEYVHNQYNQNTIYKMRWNFIYPPKQYATDIGWAAKQVGIIKELYSTLDNPVYHYDIPKFK